LVVFRLAFAEPFHQRGRPKSKRLCELHDVDERRIPFSSLDASNVGSVEAAPFGQRLLTQLLRYASATQVLAKASPDPS
jgi:hypothetical protein